MLPISFPWLKGTEEYCGRRRRQRTLDRFEMITRWTTSYEDDFQHSFPSHRARGSPRPPCRRVTSHHSTIFTNTYVRSLLRVYEMSLATDETSRHKLYL